MPLRPNAPFWFVGASKKPKPRPLNTSPAAATEVTSAYGRTGNVVGEEGDYTIDQLGDVDTTTAPPTDSNLLAWDGTNWTPEEKIDSGTFA